MYHPATPSPAEVAAGFTDDDDFEYLELRNVGNETLDLSDVRFTKGIDANLSGSLAPGEFVLVVRHQAAFELRHGTGLPVTGEFQGKLDNGGERIKLSFGAGITILDFVYDDETPWQTSPDGNGTSLVLIHPLGLPDPGNPFHWRSATPTPGTSDGTTFPGGDLLNYATQGPPQLTVLPNGNISLTVELNQLAEDIIIAIQTSPDLQTWKSQTSFVLTDRQDSPDPGHALTTFTTTTPLLSGNHFIRLHVQVK